MGGKLTPKPTNHHNVNDLQTFGGIGSVRHVEAARAPFSPVRDIPQVADLQALVHA